MPPILCTVRDCRSELHPDGRSFVCANGHSFDLSRSGYLNLLQPQDRKSAAPGDNAGAVAARRRFVDAGHVQALTRATAALLPCDEGDPVLDVGCGEGDFLSEMARRYAVDAYGIDLSTPAIDLAARRHRDCRWIIANADRFLPFPSGSLAALSSITARLNRDEFARVLAPGGRLLVAITAPDDLIELRAIAQGAALERDRVDRTVEMFAPLFAVARRERIAERVHLDRDAALDAMSASYRGLRTRERERLAAIEPMEVTLSRDVLVFTKAG